MDLEPTDEQAALRDELRRFLESRVTPEARRACADRPGAVDRHLWRALAEMGVFSLTVPEASGGVGLGWADAVLVAEELGRAAVPGPVVATALAAALLGGRLDDHAGGPAAVARAGSESGPADGPGSGSGLPGGSGSGSGLPGGSGPGSGIAGLPGGAASGEVVVGVVDDAAPALVEHLAGLDQLVVLEGDSVRLLDAPTVLAGAAALPRPLDPLTPVHRVPRLDGGTPVGDAAAAATWRRTGSLLTAALQVGLGEGALQLATAYAKERRQFGREIGSFQSLKHLLADAHTAVEVARSAVWSAAVVLDEALAAPSAVAVAGGEVDWAVAAARIVAGAASVGSGKTCVQVHGGMGYTWELDAHLFLKRALVLDTAFGSADAAIDVLAATL